ncbi:hypothetical protein QFZ28_006019 [Neobacillus niacini]|nr:hypothetical protein [Neobacillus niacini]MDQ1005441.1 hypothetical protein [Neobacillus niacini]
MKVYQSGQQFILGIDGGNHLAVIFYIKGSVKPQCCFFWLLEKDFL